MSTPVLPPLIQERHRIEFTDRYVQPPGNLYVGPDDRFFIRVATITLPGQTDFTARVLAPNGEIQITRERIETPSSRVPVESIVAGREGFLLGATLQTPAGGATQGPGDNYGFVGLIRGGNTLEALSQVFMEGYYSRQTPLFYPGGNNTRAGQGPGGVRNYGPYVAPPGTVIEIYVPAHARWKIQTVRFTYIASAVPANRYFYYFIMDGGAECFRFAGGIAQTAGQTRYYNLSPQGYRDVLTGVVYHIPLPPNLILRYDFRIRLVVTPYQLGDLYDNGRVLVEEWIEEEP